jgi:hypothetical protein
MRKISTVFAFLLLSTSLVTLARTAPARTAPDRAAGRVERRLDTLATAFASALRDPAARELLGREIAASESGDGVRLRDLLDRGTAKGAFRPESLKAVLRAVGNTPEIDVSVLPGLEAWDAATEAPLVAYVWEGAGGKEWDVVRAFDAAGTVTTFDAHQPLQRPVVVLEVHDTRGAVEPASRATGGGTAVLSEKLINQCADFTTYSTYPLITRASIWDAHESSFNGPLGFLYFSAAGSEKTGTLPASLGGLSGWSTNVWASNFQGPYGVSNSRMQWEWSADSWLEYSYRTYPAPYCRQSVGSPSSLTLSAYTIKEDDDAGNPDDYVGKSQIDHRYCKSDVFDLGVQNGWTAEHTTAGIDDIISTTYKLYCTTSPQCSATVECPNGGVISCSSSGSCAQGSCESGDGWVQCGSTYIECPSQPICPHGQILCDPL